MHIYEYKYICEVSDRGKFRISFGKLYNPLFHG